MLPEDICDRGKELHAEDPTTVPFCFVAVNDLIEMKVAFFVVVEVVFIVKKCMARFCHRLELRDREARCVV